MRAGFEVEAELSGIRADGSWLSDRFEGFDGFDGFDGSDGSDGFDRVDGPADLSFLPAGFFIEVGFLPPSASLDSSSLEDPEPDFSLSSES